MEKKVLLNIFLLLLDNYQKKMQICTFIMI